MDEQDYVATLRGKWRAAWPAGIPDAPVYPFGEVPLTDYLRRWAAIQPDKAAVIFYGSVMTYGELDRLSDRFAVLLAQNGVRPGDAVCVFMQNCPQYHVVFYGF